MSRKPAPSEKPKRPRPSSSRSPQRARKEKARVNPRHGTQTMTPAERARAKERYLDTYRQVGIVLVALRAAGVAKSSMQHWQKTDADFKAACVEAEADVCDNIRAEMHRRAVVGVTRTRVMFYKGKQVGTESITEYSDRLLELLAKSKMAEFRGLDKVEVTHGGKIGINSDQEHRTAIAGKIAAAQQGGRVLRHPNAD